MYDVRCPPCNNPSLCLIVSRVWRNLKIMKLSITQSYGSYVPEISQASLWFVVNYEVISD